MERDVKPFFIKRIWQKDNFHFCVEWNDQQVQEYRLSDLQRKCSCANCIDEATGRSLIDPRTLSSDVKAIMIRNVGRYGLQIQFTSGCSNGIYSLEELYAASKGTL